MMGKQNIQWKALTLSFFQLLMGDIFFLNSSIYYGQILAQNNYAIDNVSKCSHDLESLANFLVKDIPSYANRVMQKSRELSSSSIRVYVIVASKPEFQPLPLSPTQDYLSQNETTKQVFFTTLERQYLQKDRVIETQNYHWLLLTETPEGWRMVMIFSRLGISNPNRVPSPPKDTSNGIMGQAVKLWLRDCRAGVK
jgi:hypothetical protein